jgi:hypothetical protein
MKSATSVLIFLFYLSVCISQDSSYIQIKKSKLTSGTFSIGAGGQYGFVMALSQGVANTKGSNSLGMEIALSWQRTDRNTWDLCKCYPRESLAISYHKYGYSVLGTGLTAAYVFEPAYRIAKNTLFSFKAGVGLAYLTNPHDVEQNPANKSYGTSLNGYFMIGTGIWVRINDKWNIHPSINFHHASNAGIDQPNKGLNWLTTGFSLHYTSNPPSYYSGRRSKDKSWKNRRPRGDIAVFGIPRSIMYKGTVKRKALLGLQMQGSKQVGSINALSAGIEISNDRSLYLKMQQDNIRASTIRAALLGGHEFLLGKFIFNQRVGIYLFDQTPYFDAWFHCWGLNFRINKNIGIGFNLKVHRNVSEYADLRLLYSFQ